MAKILVLDDIADAVALIRKILERKGHDVVGFTEEEEAIAFARSHAPDLAIVDIKLKKMSGIEVLGELKNASPSTRVMMLTGYPTLETAREAIKKGASEYFVKPFEKEELEEKVEEVLR